MEAAACEAAATTAAPAPAAHHGTAGVALQAVGSSALHCGRLQRR